MRMHLAWAGRLAWGRRVWLGLALAALLLPVAWYVHAAWTLASLLALAWPYPAARAAALRRIDARCGLAYRSALETPPDHPGLPELEARAAASCLEAKPPRFPWVAMAVWGLLLVAAWVPPHTGRPIPRQTITQSTDGPSSQSSEATPLQSSENRGSTEQPGAKGVAARRATKAPAKAGEPRAGKKEGGRKAAGSRSQPPPGLASKQAGAAKPSGKESTRSSANNQPAKKAAPPAAARVRDATSAPTAASGGAPGRQANSRSAGSPGVRATPTNPMPRNTSVLPTPTGNPTPLIAGGPASSQSPLPVPWQEGRPPIEVQRQAETYLQETPLSPQVRAIIRHYFDLSPQENAAQ